MNLNDDPSSEKAIPLKRSRYAITALIAAIVGLLLFPVGMFSVSAIVLGIKALIEIKSGSVRGRGMSFASIGLGVFGSLLTVTFVLSALPQSILSAPKIEPDGIRYLKNQATMLSEYAKRAGANTKKGQMISLSSTTEGRTDSMDIYDRKGLQTASGFALGIIPTSSSQGDSTMNGIQGNLLLVSKSAVAPSLPIGMELPFGKSSPSWEPVFKLMPKAYAAENTAMVYETADPKGWKIIIEKDKVTLKNWWRRTKGEFRFDGFDLQALLLEVYAKDVSAPDSKTLKQKCSGADSVANAHVFETLRDNQKEGKIKRQIVSTNKVASLGIRKVASYNCKTNQLNFYFSIDFMGQIDGQSFQGIVHQPFAATNYDMEAIKSQMKQKYLEGTKRELSILQCDRTGWVSFKDSPIKCSASDAEGYITSATITITDTRYEFKWAPLIPPDPDMADLENVIRERYQAKTGFQLVSLKCTREGKVSYKDSPITCKAEDSQGTELEMIVTIKKDKRSFVSWNPLPKESPPPVNPAPPVNPQASDQSRKLITIGCPPGSEEIGLDSDSIRGLPQGVSLCSEQGTFRHFCPQYTEPVYGADDIAYCYNPYNEARAPKNDPASAWQGEGYGPRSFTVP